MDKLCAKLDSLVAYITPLLPLVNSHMVAFLTQNLWDNILSENIRKEFDLSQPDLFDLFFNHDNSRKGEINHFISKAKEMARNDYFIDSLKLKKKIDSWGCSDFKSLMCEEFMSSKKTHEVEVMSEIVAALMKATQSSLVIDIGDGKGYLSSILFLEYKLNVLGIDSSLVNTSGAVKRFEKMKKHWKGVRKKIKINKNVGQSDKVPENDFSSECTNNLYKQHTKFIDSQTDIKSIIAKEFPEQNFLQLGLIGLHTCGSLSPVCLRQFVNNEAYSFLVNVGCCYHLMDEGCEENSSFPLSSYLKELKFILGRNARMLSLQAPARIIASQKLNTEGLMFRAVFEQLLIDKTDYNGNPQIEVGRISSKCKNFIQYVRTASQKLPFEINMSDEEINKFYVLHSSKQNKLQFYFMIRVFLAAVIEKIILYDRLLYLKEKGIEESYLVKMFDPVVSPRCYGILAVRTNKLQNKI